jgi:hypothetical protein
MMFFGLLTGKTKFINEPEAVSVSLLTFTAEIASNTKSDFHAGPVSSKCNANDIIFGILFGPNSSLAFYISSSKLYR